MEFQTLIRTRASVRSYDPNRMIPKDVLDRILEAGRLAPSAANRQPWTFVVIRSAEVLDTVKACYKREWLLSAPAILAVTGDRSLAWVRKQDGYNSIETDLTIAMDHLILAATDEGLGTCWIEAFDPVLLREALSLGPTETVFAITPLGYPASGQESPVAKDRKLPETIVRYL